MVAAVTPEPNSGLQLTQLAHVGHIETDDGRFEVASVCLVITGMLAPRGLRRLSLFRPDGALVRTYEPFYAEPLWCEGGKIYLFGSTSAPGGIPFSPELEMNGEEADYPVAGNVIDFSRGLGKAVVRYERRYGSSGGVEDDK